MRLQYVKIVNKDRLKVHLIVVIVFFFFVFLHLKKNLLKREK